ncbi:MAG: fatty acid-binding protein DegV [Gracilibacter sp. BRH_c7a]|nr:MAG: fatty acid-binding protein DegV [Gracilibacter sp. BRH_c7a]
MKKIALVTDSTVDFTPELVEEHEVHIIPLKVLFGTQEYFDGEITSEEFYQRLGEEKELPKTSQPSPEAFSKVYSKLLEEYQEIISIHISSELSGTLNSARLAAERIKAKIHLIDTKTISLGVGMMMIEASNYIKEGLESVHILEKLAKLRTNVETVFTLNTLEYLQKGGRIGRVQGIMGQFFNIKPIIRVGDDGIYHTLGKARSQEKALNNMVESFKQLGKGRKCVRLGVAHGAALEAGLYLKEAMENAFEMPSTIFTQVGPVIGVHTGPGTIGAAVQYE